MRFALLCALTVLMGCPEKDADSAASEPVCPGDSIYIEVCIECADDGGCEEMGMACRSICDAQEDCPDGTVCTTSAEGMYCDPGCD